MRHDLDRKLNSKNNNTRRFFIDQLYFKIQQFLRSLRETGTDRHQKALYDQRPGTGLE